MKSDARVMKNLEKVLQCLSDSIILYLREIIIFDPLWKFLDSNYTYLYIFIHIDIAGTVLKVNSSLKSKHKIK